jgi:hypothetical protein
MNNYNSSEEEEDHLIESFTGRGRHKGKQVLIEGLTAGGGWGGFVKNTWTMSLTYILLGFTLAAAIAWVDLVRNLIKTYVKVRSDASLAHFIFAVCITILAVIVYMVIKGYLAKDAPDVPIIGVIR